jgi:hypothetical protein
MDGSILTGYMKLATHPCELPLGGRAGLVGGQCELPVVQCEHMHYDCNHERDRALIIIERRGSRPPRNYFFLLLFANLHLPCRCSVSHLVGRPCRNNNSEQNGRSLLQWRSARCCLRHQITRQVCELTRR